jgi:hypothetical protein
MAKPKYKVSGGVIVQPLLMLDSLAYQTLSAKSVKLMSLMQRHWRDDKAIDYGPFLNREPTHDWKHWPP